MASLQDCNDPFDCRIPTNYNLLDSDDKIENYATSFINRHKSFILENGYNLENERNLLKKDLANLDAIQSQHENELFESQNLHYGILSLSARWNSILMWSHYGDFHKGYCVGFHEDKMRILIYLGRVDLSIMIPKIIIQQSRRLTSMTL